MNASQTRLYFREWGRTRACLVGRGLSASLAHDKRHQLHREALGEDKSSKRFSNEDLDKVLAKFKSVYDDGNLDAQISAIDAIEERKDNLAGLIAQTVVDIFVLKEERRFSESQCESYVDGTAVRVLHKLTADCNATELAKLLGIFRRSLGVARRTHPVRAAAMDTARTASPQPF